MIIHAATGDRLTDAHSREWEPPVSTAVHPDAVQNPLWGVFATPLPRTYTYADGVSITVEAECGWCGRDVEAGALYCGEGCEYRHDHYGEDYGD